MNVLLVAATEAEISSTIDWLQNDSLPDAYGTFGIAQGALDICITGVGLLAATFAITNALHLRRYDFVLQAGIGGSFDKDIPLGACVAIRSEQLADIGAEDGTAFLDVFSLGFLEEDEEPFTARRLTNSMQHLPFSIEGLPLKEGLTVLTTSGSESTILKRTERYNAEIESMEGAALHYVCLQMGVPFLQLRTISNYVTRRDRSAWKIGEAIAALNAQLIQWLK